MLAVVEFTILRETAYNRMASIFLTQKLSLRSLWTKIQNVLLDKLFFYFLRARHTELIIKIIMKFSVQININYNSIA